MPNLLKASLDIERFGADGITVHPRPDARHIRYSDVRELKANIATELNVEGNPIESFCELVEEVRPAQVTLVPDAEDAITSSAGWDTIKNREFLRSMSERFHKAGPKMALGFFLCSRVYLRQNRVLVITPIPAIINAGAALPLSEESDISVKAIIKLPPRHIIAPTKLLDRRSSNAFRASSQCPSLLVVL